MLRYEVGPDDLLHTSFALSPVFELWNLLRVLWPIGDGQFPDSWATRLRPALDRLRCETPVAALMALASPRRGPGFLVPPPTRGMLQSIQDDLAAVRAVPLALARAEIATCLAIQPVTDPAMRAVLDTPDVVQRVADVLERAWHDLIAADWLQLRAICERDVVYRSGQLARHGWAAALDGLHQRVRWNDGAIEIADMAATSPIVLGGAGMTFIPSVFVWPHLAAHTDEPWPKCIIYPARGIAALWETGSAPTPQALSDLIGRSRSQILVALATPASTTQLARMLKLATGSVGDHLRAMQRAGLLDSARSGRSVLYRRTPLGDMLAEA